MNINKILDNKEFITILLIFSILFLTLLIIYATNNYYKLLNINTIINMPRNAISPIVFDNEIIPKPISDSKYSYSIWFYINDLNYDNNKYKHVFHIGEKNGKTTCPGVWFSRETNDLIIHIDTMKNERITSGELGVEAGKKCIFPFKWNWDKLHVNEPDDINPELKKLGYRINDKVPKTVTINNCEETIDKYSSTGYCTTKINANGYAEDINSFGTCNKQSSNPNVNESIIYNKNTFKIKNVGIKRWVHLVLCISNSYVNIYINGKLYKSGPLDSLPKINNGKLHITNFGGFNGIISQLKIIPFELKNEHVHNLYRNGPDGKNNILNVLKFSDIKVCKICNNN